MAIEECIRLGILKEYLETNYKEVVKMMSWQYDREKELEIVKRDAREEGLEQGLEQGAERKAIAMAMKLLSKGINIADIAEAAELPVERIEELSRKA